MKPLGREGRYPGVAGERPTACTHPGAAAGARGSEALGAQTASGSAPDCPPACRVPRTNSAAHSSRRRWGSNNRFLAARGGAAPSPQAAPTPATSSCRPAPSCLLQRPAPPPPCPLSAPLLQGLHPIRRPAYLLYCPWAGAGEGPTRDGVRAPQVT